MLLKVAGFGATIVIAIALVAAGVVEVAGWRPEIAGDEGNAASHR